MPMTTTRGTEGAGLDRRSFLAGTTAAAMAVSGTALMHSGEAWGLEVKTLKPETMATLVVMARDIYPHDRLQDRFYALAVKGYDDKAGSDAATKALIEDGVAALDAAAVARHGVPYAQVDWEAQRVALLEAMQDSKFFQTIRCNLVVGLYNQEELWPVFGYEGESASKGGYINRGFSDITWL
jgi:hypothetical protein